jgi:hypothetical protein
MVPSSWRRLSADEIAYKSSVIDKKSLLTRINIGLELEYKAVKDRVKGKTGRGKGVRRHE